VGVSILQTICSRLRITRNDKKGARYQLCFVLTVVRILPSGRGHKLGVVVVGRWASSIACWAWRAVFRGGERAALK